MSMYRLRGDDDLEPMSSTDPTTAEHPWGRLQAAMQSPQSFPASPWDAMRFSLDQSPGQLSVGPEIGDSFGAQAMPMPESRPAPMVAGPHGAPFQGEVPDIYDSFGVHAPKNRQRPGWENFLMGLATTLPASLVGGPMAGVGAMQSFMKAQGDDADRAADELDAYERSKRSINQSPVMGAAYSRARQRLASGDYDHNMGPEAVIQEELGRANEDLANKQAFGTGALGAYRASGMDVADASAAVAADKVRAKPPSDKARAIQILAKYERNPNSVTPEEAAYAKAYFKASKGNSMEWQPGAEDDAFINALNKAR